MSRILHLLAQRPSRTGSGVTLDALVAAARARGHDQRVVVGLPAGLPTPSVGGLPAAEVRPLRFESAALPFRVVGMSDTMPYPSEVWARFGPAQLDAYREAFRRHLEQLRSEFRPDLVHSHHLWLATALAREVFPDVPVVAHCHATGLRQMQLCPELGAELLPPLRAIDAFCVLHGLHHQQLLEQLGVSPTRIHTVGAGYNEDTFHSRGRGAGGHEITYAGKLSRAKGLAELLSAFERVRGRLPAARLHIAGDGAGPEAEELRARMHALAPAVVSHGFLSPAELAGLLRESRVFVLPSYYEGLPLVLVEALACGCRLVSSDLPGIQRELAPVLGGALRMVALPRLRGVDQPLAEDLPGYVLRLDAALGTALTAPEAPALRPPEETLAPFRWSAVFARVEALWDRLLARNPA